MVSLEQVWVVWVVLHPEEKAAHVFSLSQPLSAPKLHKLAKLEHVRICDTHILAVTVVQEPHIDYNNSHEMPEENQVSASGPDGEFTSCNV